MFGCPPSIHKKVDAFPYFRSFKLAHLSLPETTNSLTSFPSFLPFSKGKNTGIIRKNMKIVEIDFFM